MKLKELRQINNMTQRDLASKVGVDVSVISKYETGKLIIPTKRIEIIANALKVNPIELINVELDNCDCLLSKNRLQAYEQKFHRNTYYYLERAIILSAHGQCELCGAKAPFYDKKGFPYLEIYQIAQQEENVDPEKILVALCPNCHAKILVNPSAEELERIREIANSHIL